MCVIDESNIGMQSSRMLYDTYIIYQTAVLLETKNPRHPFDDVYTNLLFKRSVVSISRKLTRKDKD